ncbi:MAG: protocatechuate 3,4-dioxygenase beta subunit [Myxococcota bacterium]|jgi:protocatechuate 3,4-dioxygenase beta subunit
MNRRMLLISVGGATALGGVGCKGPLSTCGISREQIDGPYYLALDDLRGDVTDGKQGIALALLLEVVAGDSCDPVQDATVELWQADASGTYSGFHALGTKGERFLRGTQRGDGAGAVSFTTIYPGFYPGRTPHLHLRVTAPGYAELVTQVYFPRKTNAAVAGEYGAGDTTNDSDGFYDEENLLDIEKDGDGYLASGRIALWPA